MNSSEAGNDSFQDIPGDTPISPRGLVELNRLIHTQEKPSTPRVNFSRVNSERAPKSSKAFKLLQFKEDSPASSAHHRTPSVVLIAAEPAADVQALAGFKRTLGLNSTKTTYFNSMDPSVFGSVLSEDARPRSREPETKPTNETAEDRKSEADELGLLPTSAYCSRCEKLTLTRIRVQMPTLSPWKLLCCVNDAVQCCTQSSDWEQYQQVVHKCSVCGQFIGKVEPQDLK